MLLSTPTPYMTELHLPQIEETGFALKVCNADPPLVRFSGNGDSEAIAPLERFLKQLHGELLAKHCHAVDVDLNELYFMNSSCLKNFVAWIYKVDVEGRAYEIRFLANPRLHWQHRSLATLKRLAPKVVSIADAE